MISKYLLQVFALAAVFLVVAVPYSSAATHEISQHQVQLVVDSEHQNRYDRVVNLADPDTAITNPDTWAPSPQGIWIGASTEESLYQFDELLPSNNRLMLASSVMFSPHQIMNGASVWIVRSPISSEGVESMTMRLYRLPTPDYEWGYDDDGNRVGDGNWWYNLVYSIDVDMSDTSITSGGDYWTVDGRTYVEVHGPVYSGHLYIIEWQVHYEPDSRPSIYLSSQDVVNDDLMDTHIHIAHTTSPDTTYKRTYRWEIDPGISFDAINGLGSGIYAESKYVRSGDVMRFYTDWPPGGSLTYYTMMLPFSTDDGRLSARVELMQGYSGSPEYQETWKLWEDSRTEWTDYILTCSPEASTGYPGGYVWFKITFLESKRVNFIFADSRRTSALGDPNRVSFVLSGQEHIVHAAPWASFQRSVFPVTAPSMNIEHAVALPEVQVNDRVDYFGTIVGLAMIVAGAALIPIGVGVPLVVGGVLVAGGLGLVILEGIAHKEGYSGIGPYLEGKFSNALDNLWNSLQDAGRFLHSVGEAIYDSLVWFADAVTEYGSVLLGLLIIAVALALFFAPIYTQLKLWGIAWRMAEGDVQAAAAQAQDLASQASGVMSKLRRR